MKKGNIVQGLAIGLFAVSAAGFFVYESVKKIYSVQMDSKVENTKVQTQITSSVPVDSEEEIKVVDSKIKYLTPDPTRTLFLLDQVGGNAEELARQITIMGKTRGAIYLLIDSPGGSVIAGANLLSAMEASKAPIYTVCLKLCASMAAVIHQYGTKRYMVDRAILMFHPASIGGAQGELDKAVSFLKTLKRFVDKQTAYIAQRNGLSYQELKNLESIELWMDAEDSLERKFSDATVSVEFTPPPPSLDAMFGSGESANASKVYNISW